MMMLDLYSLKSFIFAVLVWFVVPAGTFLLRRFLLLLSLFVFEHDFLLLKLEYPEEFKLRVGSICA